LKATSALKRSFRFGVLHAPTSVFKPIASIGIAKDGGVFVSPADTGSATWSHGPLDMTRLVSEQDAVVTTPERPKLHYHRSGVVRVSLTGTPLQANSSRFTPLVERGVSTFMSVVAIRPVRLPTRELRRGDLSTIEGAWPTSVRLSLTIVLPTDRNALFEAADELGPLGLVSETPSQFVVNLAGYGHSVHLLGQIVTTDEPPLEDRVSVTVAAYPEPVNGSQALPTAAHGLWNTDVRNPILGYDDSFIWEADRQGTAYRNSYLDRFNLLPSWHPASGTRRELVHILARRAGQRLRHRS
jgi:hypothetical protein